MLRPRLKPQCTQHERDETQFPQHRCCGPIEACIPPEVVRLHFRSIDAAAPLKRYLTIRPDWGLEHFRSIDAAAPLKPHDAAHFRLAVPDSRSPKVAGPIEVTKPSSRRVSGSGKFRSLEGCGPIKVRVQRFPALVQPRDFAVAALGLCLASPFARQKRQSS